MQKINVLDAKGNKVKEIATEIFEEPIRVDIVQKIVEIEKIQEKHYSNQSSLQMHMNSMLFG